MRFRHVLALAVLPLAGCVNLGGGKPPAQLLTLSSDAPPAASAAATAGAAAVPAAIIVDEPTTDRSIAVSRLAVQVNATSIAYMKGAVWADRPARLFRNLLAETLLRRGGAIVVTDEATPPPGATRVDGTLTAFGYDAEAHAAVVRYAMVVVAGASRRQLVLETSEPAGASTAEIVPALNRAANRVAAAAADAVAVAAKP